jgi:hypothetical protein
MVLLPRRAFLFDSQITVIPIWKQYPGGVSNYKSIGVTIDNQADILVGSATSGLRLDGDVLRIKDLKKIVAGVGVRGTEDDDLEVVGHVAEGIL